MTARSLNGVTVPKDGGNTPGYGVYSKTNLTVNIVGTNNLTGSNMGLAAVDSSVTLEGDGELNATGNDEEFGIGADVNITINSGTIHATSNSPGLYAPNGNITIIGGSVIAEGNDGAFKIKPEFGSKWYKWRTSADGAFTDSQVAPYTWSATDKYVEIQPREAVAPSITTTSLAGGTVGETYSQTL